MSRRAAWLTDIAVYTEDDLIAISALQHMAFCERQCALIHVEQVWAENRLTAEGRVLHERVHDAGAESRGEVRTVRGLRLRSLRLGLSGVADVVEFHSDPEGVPVPGLRGIWTPFPVEFKRGRPKPDGCDDIQLCAQAMCLEEMLDTAIAGGALFYGQPHRRHPVAFDDALRTRTEELALRTHALIESGRTPPAMYAKRCESCSLFDLCKPQTIGAGKSARRYIGQMLAS